MNTVISTTTSLPGVGAVLEALVECLRDHPRVKQELISPQSLETRFRAHYGQPRHIRSTRIRPESGRVAGYRGIALVFGCLP